MVLPGQPDATGKSGAPAALGEAESSVARDATEGLELSGIGDNGRSAGRQN